ncbi:MAG: glycyl-radical enzyme activating protein, partial [Proteobacteria bacterium]|nr:glycyl-radical enzyme activating protein [Pseudomonadota bacterium]
PRGAIQAGEQRIDWSRCDACGQCARVCPNQALRLVGRSQTPNVIFQNILADRRYYDATGGGVTLSGGEPLLQADGAAALLALCQEAGLNTVVETSGAAPWSAFERVMPLVDRFYFDLKGRGNGRHRALTGRTDDAIIANAARLVEAGAQVQFRMPIVPGLNDSPQSLEGIAELLKGLGQDSISLLRYHQGGEAKIGRLDSDQPALGLSSADAREALRTAARRFEELGLAVHHDQANVQGAPIDRGRKTFSERVWRLRGAVQAAAPEVCAERALLVTRYFRKKINRKKPTAVAKAEALSRVLIGKTATIYDDELLVGCFSSKRVGGSIFPELHGVAMLEDLLAFKGRGVNPLKITARDGLALGLKVFPFWANRFLARKAFPFWRALRFIVGQLGGKRYLINESAGVSHFVPDYQTLLERGTRSLADEARRKGAETDNDGARQFYRAVEIVCQGLEDMAGVYAGVARRLASEQNDPARRAELEAIAERCEWVPGRPARTLAEAFQSILFAQIALNLESLDNAVSPGRLDQVLYPYYRADVEAGRITPDQARELVGCFTVKMSEIIPVFSRRATRFHGGLFSGQVVVVGGMDAQGQDATNELTWMFLDAMDHLRMRQPNYHARIHRHSPRPYVERVARMLRDGSGAPALMNDEVVVPTLVGRGTALEHARDYSPVGCVEPVACGLTFGSTDAALVNLALCLEWALGLKRGGAATSPPADCRTMDDVIDLYLAQVDWMVKYLLDDLQAIERANAVLHPTPLTSMLLQGCLESGIDASSGGAMYNGSGVQGVGVADVADSLAAIEEVVFKRGACDLATLIRALKDDFRGHRPLRALLLGAPKFGNDDSDADRYADLVIGSFAEALSRHTNTRGGSYWAGYYSVTSHVAFGEKTGALPNGRLGGLPLSNGLSPANGQERLGPTATLNSIAKLDLQARARNGINLNLKIDGSSLAGPEGVQALAGLVRGYFDGGGMQVQVNVLDPSVLLEARDHPEKHPGLLVRVSGYSAYFNDLSPAMKQEIIDRALHHG